MTFAEYKKSLSELGHGKRLPGAIYVHTECMPLLPDALRAVVLKIADTLSLAIEAGAASVDSHTFNLLKFHLASFKLSFLRYPDFWNDPHPALAEAVTVDLASGSARRQNFAPRANPPILHRKEAFLPPDHPQVPTFAALTRAEESFGLFAETHTIGFRDNWNRLVASKGLAYEDHQLCPLPSPAPETARKPVIDRHLTALVRQEFSKPVKTMLETALLAPGKDFFDYGCGYGSDARGLSAMGYQAAGWDPAHAPDHPVFPADVVNLGFVLNVIEDPAERVDTLVKAWNVSRRVLVVTTLVAGCESSTAHTGYGDGVRTSRNTFQKYFEQTELQSLLEQALHVEPIPLGLGMFAVFRDDSAREDFLSRRSRRHFDWHQISRRLGFAPPPRQRRDVYAEHGPLLDDFWATMLELGRLPAPDEYSRMDEVRKACGSAPAAERLFIERFGEATLSEARRRREEDLLVYLALASFDRRRTPFSRLSPQLQRGIRTFFGDHAKANKEAYYLLRGAGSPDDLAMAIEDLPFGWFDEKDGHFTIHRSLLDELPPVLRIYVGCGARLYGDPREADLIKIHLQTKKLTLTWYDNFDEAAFPELSLRVKIDFRRMFVSVFESPPGPKRTLLFFKERFLPKDQPNRPAMEKISARLRKLGATETNVGHGVEKGDWEKFLEQKGLTRSLLPSGKKNHA